MSREDWVDMAKLAEQAERYEDMKEAMVKIISIDADLKTEERNLLSVAFKNIVGAKRSGYRVLSNILEKETSERKKEYVISMLDKVGKELNETCSEILKLLEDKLLPATTCPNTKVFYLKMKGDYHRYLAEGRKEEEQEKPVQDSLGAYQRAVTEASSLKPTDPIRLGLALNFSVFYYEILQERDKACELAKKAFDDAIAELDTVDEKDYKDSTLIMQLLRDNLTLWTSDDNQDQQQVDED